MNTATIKSINLTDSAKNRILAVLENENESNFRVYVTGGGCSGFQYGFKFDSDVAFDDDVINFDKFDILLDSLSYPYLYGSTLDFKEDLSGAEAIKTMPGINRFGLDILNDEVGRIVDLGIKSINSNMMVSSFIPNAPASSKFTAIEVLGDGRLVGASSNGLSIKDFDGWRNILEVKIDGSNNIHSNYNYNEFIADTIPYDFGDAVSDIEQGPNGLVYVGIEGTYPTFSNPDKIGGGILVIDIDNTENISVIDTTILSYYTSSSTSRPYIVVKDLEFDQFSNLWVANAYATNKSSPIHVKNINNEWRSYGSSETQNRISQSPISIAFDNWSRPWFSAFKAEEANLGVYPDGGIFALSYNGNAVEPLDFSWESILYNSTIWSIGFSGNRLYYLTPTGLNYYDIVNGPNPVVGQNQYSYFPNIAFGGGSKLKIDEQGNIWTISTTQGIHVLLENTTYWPTINGLRQSNSPLLSDEVYDIDFDNDRKLAYIATSKGISVLRIPFGKSYEDYSSLKIFPSPFKINEHNFMTVDGLPFNSSMKILTLDGLVIRDIAVSYTHLTLPTKA